MKQSRLSVVLLSIIFGFLGGFGGMYVFHKLAEDTDNLLVVNQAKASEQNDVAQSNSSSSILVSEKDGAYSYCTCQDFITAAEKARKAVVHIKTEYYTEPDIWSFLFGNPVQTPIIKGSGSGVIISPNGYIVTNNHVIENATSITVTLYDNRTFKAKIIGRDPATDIALLKIDADNLPVLPFGDSDRLKVGEWVLAVGNPFNLNSTVTAGIVSAKGRSVSILDKRYAIESFIQTDAAINPGNSGGALVNLKGELIGINTAIASPTGVFAGYGFAVPVNIVRKVVADLLEYGSVQRAFLGVQVTNITDELAKKFGLTTYDGVLVLGLDEKGAAKDAGIKIGDVIVAVDGYPTHTVPDLLERIGQHRPGDKVTVTVLRHNKKLDIPVVLRNEEGNTKVIVHERIELLGATFQDVSQEELRALGLKYGVKVVDLGPGKLRAVGVRPGFIIVKVNDKPVHSVEELKKIINNVRGGVYIQGVYPDGTVAYYAFGLR